MAEKELLSDEVEADLFLVIAYEKQRRRLFKTTRPQNQVLS